MMPVPLVSVRNCERKPIRPRAGNAELQAHAAAAVVDHLGHRAAARAEPGDHHALEVLGDVDHELLDRLHALAVDLLGDDLGPRHLQLVALAAHHLDQDRELQLAAAEHLELLRRVGRLDAQRDVAEQLLVEALARWRDVTYCRRGRPSARC